MNATDINTETDDLLDEYDIDYSKAKRNPYYKKDRTFVELAPEVARVFNSSEKVNKVLKAIIKSMPKKAAVL